MVRDVLYHGRRTSDKKMILNKRTLILASSLAAIPLATLLVASAIRRRRRRKSPQTHQFLRATKSTTAVNANSVLDRQQLKGKAQGQQSTSWQESEIKAVMRATDGTITSKSTTTAATTTTTVPSAIPSIIVPSSTSDSGVIVSHQTPKEEERSLSEEARKAGGSLKELIVTAVKEAKDSAKQTGKRVSEQTINITATVDSKDIRSLGDNVNALVDIFEKTMTEIRKESYDDQIKLLDSYKELLHRHLKVIHARSRMASKLKPGA